MRVIGLRAENIKRLRAVEIVPTGDVVNITGRNAQGKSSVLDSLVMAICGERALPDKPVRSGEAKAFTEVDLGEYVVRRTFTATGGTSLTVKAKDGSLIKSPQGLLDSLYGKLAFDPLAFTRMNDQKAQETLRQIVGLDTSIIDTERAQVFAERTEVNRRLKGLEAQVQAVDLDDAAPTEKVSISGLVEELKGADAAYVEAERLKKAFDEVTGKWKRARTQVEAMEKEIAALREKIAKCEQEITLATQTIDATRPLVVEAKDAYNAAVAELPNRDAIRTSISEADATNAAVEANQRSRALIADMQAAREEAARLTDQIEELDAQKRNAVAGAKYPVPGLSFDDEGRILFNGEPFSQASTAEQLRVSVAIGMALHPTLRVLIVRNGNDLDASNLALLAHLAAEHDAQVWVERVAESSDGVSILIEDGEVASAPTRPAAPPREPKPAATPRSKRAFRNTGDHAGFVDFEGRDERLVVPAGQTVRYPLKHAVAKVSAGIEEIEL